MQTNRQQLLAHIAAKIDQIEQEMRRIGYWQANPPDLLAQYESGQFKSYLDAPTFELWLQCVLIPRARAAAKIDALPKQSQVGGMAMRQYDYHSQVPEASGLLELLHQFDKMVIEAASLGN